MSALSYEAYAVWVPIVWIVAMVVIGIVVLVWRNRGRKSYKKGTAQTDIFLSGIRVPSEEQRHVKAENVYWGFFEALKGFYSVLMRPHTGVVNDYILWFVAVVATAILILLLGT